MITWFRRKSNAPTILADNPGQGITVRAAFAGASRIREEEVDLVESLAAVMRTQGIKAQRHATWLELDSGIVLQPQIVSFEPHEGGGVKTATTIQASHERLIPSALFEYQHAVGDNLQSALAQGFEGWTQMDLLVLQEALRDQPKSCSSLEVSYPENDCRGPLKRRIVLGPASHAAKKTIAEDEEHPFCPCCLFTNSMAAFREILEINAFYGVRLFVMRDQNGVAEADCRVNGRDWNAGVEALIKYAQGWPDRGFEFRKQYVAIQSVATPPG